MPHTPGPWRQGRLLETAQTRQWPIEKKVRYDAEERRMVFAHFTEADEGRSRVLVARCEREEDAHLIAAVADLAAALQSALDELEWLAKAPDSDYARPDEEVVSTIRATLAKIGDSNDATPLPDQ